MKQANRNAGQQRWSRMRAGCIPEKIAADVLKRIEFPSNIIVIGPKHTREGVDWAVAPHHTWALPNGNLESNVDLAQKLAETIPGLELDAAAHRSEHAIEVELPMIQRLAPQARVVGIAHRWREFETL